MPTRRSYRTYFYHRWHLPNKHYYSLDHWPIKITDETIGADVYLVHAPREKLSPSEQKFVDIAQELLAIYPNMV